MPIEFEEFQCLSPVYLTYQKMGFHERKAYRIKFGVPEKYRRK
jgi:hypothetical protein